MKQPPPRSARPMMKHHCSLCGRDCGGCLHPTYQCEWLLHHDHTGPPPDAMAVNEDGTSLPMNPRQVQDHVSEILRNGGEIMAVIVKRGDELAVPVFGPPSREILEILKVTVRAYERTLRGH